MKKIIFIVPLLVILAGCTSLNQNNITADKVAINEEKGETIQTEFSTYSEAMNYVRSNDNFVVDTVDTSESSWIRGAWHYYTEDEKYSYTIFNLNGKEYIHKGIPMSVWEGFKQADSFGSYYNKYIKGKYTLYLR